MSSVRFIFQAYYPDSVGVPGIPDGTELVVYDAEYDGTLLSMRMAQILPAGEQMEVRHDLPFECAEFPYAVLAYRDFILHHRGGTVVRSGPKGMRRYDNVFRAEWAVTVECSAESVPSA